MGNGKSSLSIIEYVLYGMEGASRENGRVLSVLPNRD